MNYIISSVISGFSVLGIMVALIMVSYDVGQHQVVMASDPIINCLADNSIALHGPMQIQFAESSAVVGKNVGITFGESTQYNRPSWKDFALSLQENQ